MQLNKLFQNRSITLPQRKLTIPPPLSQTSYTNLRHSLDNSPSPLSRRRTLPGKFPWKVKNRLQSLLHIGSAHNKCGPHCLNFAFLKLFRIETLVYIPLGA